MPGQISNRWSLVAGAAALVAATALAGAPVADASPGNDNFGNAQAVGPGLPLSVAGSNAEARRLMARWM